LRTSLWSRSHIGPTPVERSFAVLARTARSTPALATPATPPCPFSWGRSTPRCAAQVRERCSTRFRPHVGRAAARTPSLCSRAPRARRRARNTAGQDARGRARSTGLPIFLSQIPSAMRRAGSRVELVSRPHVGQGRRLPALAHRYGGSPAPRGARTRRELHRRARASRALDSALETPPANMHEVVHAPPAYPFSYVGPRARCTAQVRESRSFLGPRWGSSPAVG
jgi:hypothetical protein